MALVSFGCSSGVSEKEIDHNKRGNTYSSMGSYGLAIDEYSEAIRLGPEEAVFYYNRANAYDETHQCRNALSDYDKAILLDPKEPDYHNNRGLFYMNVVQHRRFQENLPEIFHELKKGGSKVLGGYECVSGFPASHQELYLKAILNFDEAIRIYPQSANYYSNRGIAYFRLDQTVRALEDYDEAIRVDPEYANAHFNRGLVHLQKREYQRAVADFEEATRLAPEDADAHGFRAVAYRAVGRDEEARLGFQQAEEMGFDSSSVDDLLSGLEEQR